MGLGTDALNSEVQTNSSQDQQSAQQALNPTTVCDIDEAPIVRMMDNSSECTENFNGSSDTEQPQKLSLGQPIFQGQQADVEQK